MTREPLFVLMCIISFLTAPLHAQSLNVTNTADSGAGSLRQIITNSNAFGGSNTISWGAGSGGTLTLLSSLPSINAGTTLDVSNAPSAVTIAGSPNAIPIAGAATFNNASAQNWTISSVISGAGTLTQAGGGTLILTGNNTYSGGTNLNGGILNINNDAALGNAAGVITFNGGAVAATLQTATGITSNRGIALNNSGTFDTQGLNSTLNGTIVGNGSLNILGSGKVTITGTNFYANGTSFQTGILSINNSAALGTGAINFNGGTLQTTVANISITSMTLNTATDTLDTQGNSVNLPADIGGSGTLNIINDTPTTVLSFGGNNSWSGGTVFNTGILNVGYSAALGLSSSLGSGPITFNGGTLQTSSTMTISNLITLNAAGGSFDTQGNLSILAGVISGVGGLTNVSTGTLTITGANTYTGVTTLSSGTINVNNSAALGTNSIIFNGGILQFGAGTTLANNMTLTQTATIDTNGGTNDTLTGNLSGAGGLTKINGGILTLIPSVANTYGGATNVLGGTLQLGGAGAVPTGTALTVANGATFDMQSFTQTVASYDGSGGGAMKMVLKTGGGNSLTVTGNANLTNGTLSVALPSGAIVTKGQTFTPIHFGTLTGNVLPSTILSPAALSFTPSLAGNNVLLTVGFVPFASLSASGNQASIGNALEPLRIAPSGDSALVMSNLYTMNLPQLQAALDQIGPISLAAMSGVGRAESSVQSAAVGQRMAVLADGRDHLGFSQYSVARRSFYPGTLVAAAGESDEPGNSDSAPEAPGSNSPWGYFATGAATAGKLTDANSTAGAQPGYAFNSGGLTGGADYRLDDHFTVGAAAGYLRGHASIYTPGSGTVDDQSGRLGLYGVATADKLHANLYVGGAVDTFTMKRGINFGTISRTATGKPSGGELTMNSSLSYDYKYADWGIFSPFAGLNYDRLMIGGFTETGADSLDLSVNSQTSESLQSTLGMRFSKKYETEKHIVTPYVSLGWRREFDDQSRPITAQFAGGGGTPFAVMTGSYARDGTVIGSGVSATLGKNMLGRFDWTSDFRSHYQDTTVNATLRFRF